MDDGFRWEEFMLKLAECLYFTECLGRKRSVLEDAVWLKKKRLITDKIPAAILILQQYFYIWGRIKPEVQGIDKIFER